MFDEENGVIKINEYMFDGKIPDYVYDKHTWKGKKMGKTSKDFDETEGKALKPHQKGLFDDAPWVYDEDGNNPPDH